MLKELHRSTLQFLLWCKFTTVVQTKNKGVWNAYFLLWYVFWRLPFDLASHLNQLSKLRNRKSKLEIWRNRQKIPQRETHTRGSIVCAEWTTLCMTVHKVACRRDPSKAIKELTMATVLHRKQTTSAVYYNLRVTTTLYTTTATTTWYYLFIYYYSTMMKYIVLLLIAVCACSAQLTRSNYRAGNCATNPNSLYFVVCSYFIRTAAQLTCL